MLERPERPIVQDERSIRPMTETEKVKIISKVSEALELSRANDTNVAEKMAELLASTDGKVENGRISEAQLLIDHWDFEAATELLSAVLSDLSPERT